jgi:hypothetical protein
LNTSLRELSNIIIQHQIVRSKFYHAIKNKKGERYDLIVNANQEIDNYWIRAKGFADCGNFKVFQTAILNYKANGETSDRIPTGPMLDYDTMSRTGLVSIPFMNNRITKF